MSKLKLAEVLSRIKKSKGKDPKLEEREGRVQKQIIREFELLRLYKPCNPYDEDILSIIRKIHDVDPSAIDLIFKDYHNPALMETFSCLVRALSHEGQLGKNERLRKYLKKFFLIGKDSSNGNAYRPELSNNGEMSKPFVIKTPKEKDSSQVLIHEAIVGIYATNSLRQFIPNFAYVHGIFDCSMPFGQHSWCISDGKDDVPYIVYENIKGESADSFLRDCSEEQFYSFYIQTILALKLANEQFKFTHYDLHADNIIMLETNEHLNVRYPLKNGDKYLLVKDKIPVLIDYGSSYFKNGEESFGTTELWLRSYGVNEDIDLIMMDAFKLLMYSFFTLRKFNYPVYKNVRSLFEFFSDERPERWLSYHGDEYYSLHDSEKVRSLSFDGLIDFCIEKSNGMVSISDSKIGDYPVFGCEEMKCDPVKTIMREIGLESNSTPNDFLKMYDQIMTVSEDERKGYIDLYRENVDTATLKICNDYSSLAKNLNAILPPGIPFKNPEDDINDETVEDGVKKYALSVATYFSKIKDLSTNYKVLNFFRTYYEEANNAFKYYKALLESQKSNFIDKRVSLRRYIKYFDPNSEGYEAIWPNNNLEEIYVGEERWYMTEFPKLLDSIPVYPV